MGLLCGLSLRDRYGEVKQPLVQLNVGQLHTEAMRRRTLAALLQPKLVAVEEPAIIEQVEEV